MKNIIKKKIGEKRFNQLVKPLKYIRNYWWLYSNFITDRKLYQKYSNVFQVDNLKKKEAKIILYYHSIEKGFLFLNPKPRFAKDKVIFLHKLFEDDEVIRNIGLTQIQVGFSVMCRYYELHKEMGIDIEDYYSNELYDKYAKILNDEYSSQFKGIISFEKDDFYSKLNSDFLEFSESRKSIRDFTGELIDEERIENAVRLAINSPSVCNRQSVNVYLLQNKEKIDKLLKIQAGFRGYSENVKQLLVVTSDRNYFYTVGERNQLYIDGGIFLMNLLYSLHFNKIANCPANWGKTTKEDRLAAKIIDLKESEKIICLIPIGEATDNFRVCLSKRRNLSEIFYKIG